MFITIHWIPLRSNFLRVFLLVFEEQQKIETISYQTIHSFLQPHIYNTVNNPEVMKNFLVELRKLDALISWSQAV